MKKIYLIAIVILALLTGLSLALNGVVLFGLLKAREVALDAQQATLRILTDSRTMLDDLAGDTFTYTLTVDQDIPIATSIPFDQEIVVPINTVIPIDTTVTIPINMGPLGTRNIEVPVNTIVPIDLEVAIPVSQTVDINTTVPLRVDVPIEIPLADTPLVGYLDEMDANLARLQQSVERMGEKLSHPLGR